MALKQKAHILGRVPANVKFEVVKVFDDGSYLSWIAPERKSKKKGVSPLRISFTGSLKVMRRAVPVCQSNPEPELDSHYYSWILAEIGDLIIPPRQNRSNPRVVKKPRSKFNSAKPKHRGKGTIIQTLNYQMCYPKAA